MTEAGVATRHWRPRIGCAGMGWIGENRLRAVADSGLGDIVAIADPDPARRDAAAASVGATERRATLDELLELDLDGVMIASPSALHADQAVAALSRGVAVFCQKPLARTATEASRMVLAAAVADCLLGQDEVIEASVYGTRGAGRMRNVDGSFFDFVAERCRGTPREPLSEPLDALGGRAAIDWARRLAWGARFDPVAWKFIETSRALDRIYAAQAAWTAETTSAVGATEGRIA